MGWDLGNTEVGLRDSGEGKGLHREQKWHGTAAGKDPTGLEGHSVARMTGHWAL